jgi:hypothetical protein
MPRHPLLTSILLLSTTRSRASTTWSSCC